MTSFQFGDLVLALKPSVGNKLLGSWKGPYTVIDKVSTHTYRLKKDRRSNKVFTYHINLLQRWISPSAMCLFTIDTPPLVGPPQTQPWTHTWQSPSTPTSQLHKGGNWTPCWRNSPGSTEISIRTTETKPCSSPPYRLPHARKSLAVEEIKKMLTDGIIRPSKSPWASPLHLVEKKDGSLRPVVDYRRLNKLSIPDPFPMPRIEDLIDGLSSARFITTLDLTKGYWQISVAKDSQEKTAFVTEYGKYEFCMMPFGLMGAPAVFQRLMGAMFGDINQFVAAYLDDIVIFSDSWEDHQAHLQEVFTRVLDSGLTLKPKKCILAQKECEFLGHMVGHGMVRPLESKIADVRDFVRPEDVRSFIGLANYYRRFVPHFSTLAAPLTDLTKDCLPKKVAWGPPEEAAFTALKSALCSSPVLQGPKYDREFLLHTDASDIGIGAVLSQVSDDGLDLPVAYYARKLLPRERNYATTDRECLAIVDGIKHFAVYLTGVRFTVVTDHHCLQYLQSVQDAGGRRTRWSLLLHEYHFAVIHRPGSANGNADGLSRQAWSPFEELEGVEGSVVSWNQQPQQPVLPGTGSTTSSPPYQEPSRDDPLPSPRKPHP